MPGQSRGARKTRTAQHKREPVGPFGSHAPAATRSEHPPYPCLPGTPPNRSAYLALTPAPHVQTGLTNQPRHC